MDSELEVLRGLMLLLLAVGTRCHGYYCCYLVPELRHPRLRHHLPLASRLRSTVRRSRGSGPAVWDAVVTGAAAATLTRDGGCRASAPLFSGFSSCGARLRRRRLRPILPPLLVLVLPSFGLLILLFSIICIRLSLS